MVPNPMVPAGTSATVLHRLAKACVYVDCVVAKIPAAFVPVAHTNVGLGMTNVVVVYSSVVVDRVVSNVVVMI
jgi:hypothetical protein